MVKAELQYASYQSCWGNGIQNADFPMKQLQVKIPLLLERAAVLTLNVSAIVEGPRKVT